MNEINNKIRGSLLCGAIGDALGYQIEFKRGIKEKEVTRFNGKGIISDDTQMTLYTANALLWRETRGSARGIVMSIPNAVYLGYKDWLDTQLYRKSKECISWIKEIPELNKQRSPGNTCISALMSGEMGTVDDPINNSKGCGSVMRVAPLGLFIKDSKEAGENAALVGAITHGHPLGIIPCYVLASMISLIVYKNMSIIDALETSINELMNSDYDKESVKEFIKLINKAIKLSKSDTSDLEAINELGEGWVAEEALAIAIYSSLKYSNSVEDSIVCSINHDGDSDSTGSLTGNIVGASLGMDKIPSYYLDNLELKDVIIELADDLSNKDKVPEYTNEDEYWLSKYSNCHKDLSKKKK